MTPSEEQLLMQERADLRKAFILAMHEVAMLRGLATRQAKTLSKMHNNFRAMKGLPEQKPIRRPNINSVRRRHYFRQVRRCWFKSREAQRMEEP